MQSSPHTPGFGAPRDGGCLPEGRSQQKRPWGVAGKPQTDFGFSSQLWPTAELPPRAGEPTEPVVVVPPWRSGHRNRFPAASLMHSGTPGLSAVTGGWVLTLAAPAAHMAQSQMCPAQGALHLSPAKAVGTAPGPLTQPALPQWPEAPAREGRTGPPAPWSPGPWGCVASLGSFLGRLRLCSTPTQT